MCIIAI